MAPEIDPLPLSDLLVLDLTIARAGPTAVRQLADWGANVIHIERRQTDELGALRHSPDSLNLNRNKRSLTLDLKRQEGRALLHRMVERADILVENMRPPVKSKLGFDWDTLSAINPRLVMGSISGFGQDGPYAERGGVDQIAQGLGGMMSVTGIPGQGPVRAGVAISDVTAGLQLAVGLLVAIHERARTGRGRHVHTSLLESMIGMLDFQAARWTVAREIPPQAGNHHPTMGPMGMYETADGHINLAAPWGRIWTALCEILERPDLAKDARFSGPLERAKNRDALNEEITRALQARSTSDWVEAMNAVGIPSGPVNNVEQTFADPQVEHLGIATPVTHPILGEIEILRNATHLEGVSSDIRRPAPEPGEHSDEILREFGLAGAEIDSLRENGII
ncbi:MAG: CoA transferase [bacterium]|nr:formyl-CoA transferase [Deltaproteobacteria bacterium]MCP4904367.1 CoA transferase [bacterium]